MLKNVLNTLISNGYKNIIFTQGIEECLQDEEKEYIEKEFTSENIDDVRSATFFALGKENLHSNCIIIVNGEEIQNILTGITETWFQKLNVFVIALYSKYDDIKTDFLRRVVPNIIQIYDEDYSYYENSIDKAIKTNYPSLITLKHEIKNVQYNYKNLLKYFDEILNEQNELILYNSNKNVEMTKYKVNNIEAKYKYGIISKYMGYIEGSKKKKILCIPAKVFLLELNILNNRYINENFKIIIFNCNKDLKDNSIENWVNNNNIKSMKAEMYNKETLYDFISKKEATILLVEGEI